MLEKILTTKQLPVWADQYAQAVAAAYQPDCIILFGSVARDEQDTDSDIDILVIGGELPGDQRSRFRELMRLRPVLAPIQVHAYSRDEWESMMAQRPARARRRRRGNTPSAMSRPSKRFRTPGKEKNLG